VINAASTTPLGGARVSISDTAFSVGFAGMSAFSGSFRRVTRLMWMDYRRSLE